MTNDEYWWLGDGQEQHPVYPVNPVSSAGEGDGMNEIDGMNRMEDRYWKRSYVE